MALTIKDVFLDDTEQEMLFRCGEQDRRNGVDRYDGWQQLSADMNLSSHRATPARERYEDGWFSVDGPPVMR